MTPKRNLCQKHVFVTKRTQLGPKSIPLKPPGYKNSKELEFRIKNKLDFENSDFYKNMKQNPLEHYLGLSRLLRDFEMLVFFLILIHSLI